MSRLTLVLLACLVCYSAADSDLVDYFKNMEPFKIRDSSLACPVPLVGQTCPEGNPLFYFRCCGELAQDCCFRPQDWVSLLTIILAVLIVLSVVINIIRCLFCY